MIRNIRITFVLAVISGLIGCGSDGDSEAFLRILHGSPDAPNVDVLVDGEVVLSDVAFTESSGYLEVDEGVRNVQVNVAGTDTTVIDADLDVSDSDYVTVIAGNLVAALQPFVLDDASRRAPQGTVQLRAFHGAPSAPSVDIYVTAPGDDIASLTPVLSGVPFGVASDYLEIPAGNYQVRITVAGTKTVAIDSGAVTLPSSGVFTAVAVDAAGGGGPFGLLVLQDK